MIIQIRTENRFHKVVSTMAVQIKRKTTAAKVLVRNGNSRRHQIFGYIVIKVRNVIKL